MGNRSASLKYFCIYVDFGGKIVHDILKANDRGWWINLEGEKKMRLGEAGELRFEGGGGRLERSRGMRLREMSWETEFVTRLLIFFQRGKSCRMTI